MKQTAKKVNSLVKHVQVEGFLESKSIIVQIHTDNDDEDNSDANDDNDEDGLVTRFGGARIHCYHYS